MGMDIYGQNGTYFRANIWSWRAILYALHLSGYDTPPSWGCNDGAGLSYPSECNRLADQLEEFLARWDGNTLVLECETLRVDTKGCFVDPGTADSRSPYKVERSHLIEFIEFLRSCDGFEIC
jgi:hypothetical protein